MLQIQTNIKITDNSGAKKAQCIKIYKKRTASIGDLILVSIKKIKKKATSKSKISIKPGNLFKSVIVRTVYKKKDCLNQYLRFNENSGVLLNVQTNQPLSTRILGPVPYYLRYIRQCKIVSLSAKFI